MKKVLQKATEIIQQHPLKAHQEGFFTLLGRYQYDELFHSQILASLLKKEYSLSKFLEVVGIKNCVNQGIKVEIEKGTDENRRMDIWIETKEGIILIENKINAKDQPAQVWDYYQYVAKQGKSFHLLYLTLNGKEPSIESRKILLPHQDFRYISYRKHIQKWLEKI